MADETFLKCFLKCCHFACASKVWYVHRHGYLVEISKGASLSYFSASKTDVGHQVLESLSAQHLNNDQSNLGCNHADMFRY